MDEKCIILRITNQYLNDRLAELTEEFDSALSQGDQFLRSDTQKCVQRIQNIRLLLEIPEETMQLVERAWKLDYMASSSREKIRPTNKYVHKAFMKAIDAMKPYMTDGKRRSEVLPTMYTTMDTVINELNAQARSYKEKINNEKRGK